MQCFGFFSIYSYQFVDLLVKYQVIMNVYPVMFYVAQGLVGQPTTLRPQFVPRPPTQQPQWQQSQPNIVRTPVLQQDASKLFRFYVVKLLVL